MPFGHVDQSHTEIAVLPTVGLAVQHRGQLTHAEIPCTILVDYDHKYRLAVPEDLVGSACDVLTNNGIPEQFLITPSAQ